MRRYSQRRTGDGATLQLIALLLLAGLRIITQRAMVHPRHAPQGPPWRLDHIQGALKNSGKNSQNISLRVRW